MYRSVCVMVCVRSMVSVRRMKVVSRMVRVRSDMRMIGRPSKSPFSKVEKVLRNGQVFIIRNGNTYDLTGRKAVNNRNDCIKRERLPNGLVRQPLFLFEFADC